MGNVGNRTELSRFSYNSNDKRVIGTVPDWINVWQKRMRRIYASPRSRGYHIYDMVLPAPITTTPAIPNRFEQGKPYKEGA